MRNIFSTSWKILSAVGEREKILLFCYRRENFPTSAKNYPISELIQNGRKKTYTNLT